MSRLFPAKIREAPARMVIATVEAARIQFFGILAALQPTGGGHMTINAVYRIETPAITL